MTIFKAAIVQMRAGIEPEENAVALERLVGEAAAKGAAYIQTPEMTGMLCRDRGHLFSRLHDEDNDPIVSAARDLSRRHRIVLHLGSTAIALGNDTAANRALIFGPDGSILARYDKIHMFDVDLDNGESWRESRTYRPGEAACVTDLDLGSGRTRLGLAICYDMRFPELFRAQALAGAEILTSPAAFTRQTGEAHWHVLLRARAIENGAFMLAAAQGGRHEDGRETFGHSIAIDPWGRILAEIEGAEPGIAIAEIDTGAVAATRAKIPNLKNRRPFTADFATPRAEEAAE